MHLIDTHCHLSFYKDPKKVVERAKKAGVTKIINIGISIDGNQKTINISNGNKNVYTAIGVYPNNDRGKSPHKIQSDLEKQVKTSKKIVAIGECGIDISKWKSQRPVDEQIKLFKMQVMLANKYNLPLIIHNRKANKELLSVLQPYAMRCQLSAVFHCFTGSKKFLLQLIELGFNIGVGGLATYDQGLQEVIKHAPLNRILLETDSPYLTPEPARQTENWPNEPKNVRIIAEKIAEIRGDSFLKIAKQTTKNAERLFKF